MKTEIGLVASAMKQAGVDPEKIRNVVDMLNAEAQKDDDEEKPPAVKKQFVVIVSDPLGKMPKHDFVSWVVQIPESESCVTAIERIHRTAYDYNATRKGQLMPVKTVGEAIEAIPAKAFKEEDVWIKTKTPVLVITTDNEIPKATTE